MRVILAAAPWLVVSTVFACSHQEPASPSRALSSRPSPGEILPLVRIRLYASGVGYFERHGDLDSGQKTLPVPTGHLDDALKSLVLLGPDSRELSLSFPSRLSPAVARSRAGLPADVETALSYDRLLAALRGEEVELVLTGPAAKQNPSAASARPTRTLRGRIIEVVSVGPTEPSYDHGPVHRTVPKGQEEAEKPQRLQVILLSSEREVIRFDMTELASVRPLDPSIAERLEAAMSARIAARSNQTEWLKLARGGQAIRGVRLGYLAEAPVWRASYRLVLDDFGSSQGSRVQPELQAWALIHNDTEEVWRNVKLELVDGYPSSFLFPLAAPRYQRRDLAHPDAELSSVPQLSTTTPDAMWGDFSSYEGETVAGGSFGDEIGDAFGAGGLGLSGVGEGGGGSGSGYGRGSRIGYEGSDLIWVGDLMEKAGMTPTVAQAVSVFAVTPTIDLPPQHSTTLPFLKVRVAAKPIVWFSAPNATPERAVGVSNSTSNTLPAGPLAVFGRGGFLGEALLQSLKPGARQFARIGNEPDMDLAAVQIKRSEERKHVDFRGGDLRTHSIQIMTINLLFNNRTGRTAETYVGMPIVTNATLEGSDRVDFDSTTSTPFAVFDVPTGPGLSRTVTVRQAVSSPVAVDQLEPEQLGELIADPAIPEPERAILRKAMVPLQARLSLLRSKAELDLEHEAVEGDLTRLKEASSSLKGEDSGNAGAVITQRVLKRHDELRALEAKKRALEKDLEHRTTDLRTVLSELDALREAILQERKRLETASPSAR